MFFIRENDAENHWIDKDMPTDISIVDCIVVYTISRNKRKKLNRTENKKKKTHEVLNIQKKTQIQAKRKKGKQMRS